MPPDRRVSQLSSYFILKFEEGGSWDRSCHTMLEHSLDRRVNSNSKCLLIYCLMAHGPTSIAVKVNGSVTEQSKYGTESISRPIVKPVFVVNMNYEMRLLNVLHISCLSAPKG